MTMTVWCFCQLRTYSSACSKDFLNFSIITARKILGLKHFRSPAWYLEIFFQIVVQFDCNIYFQKFWMYYVGHWHTNSYFFGSVNLFYTLEWYLLILELKEKPLNSLTCSLRLKWTEEINLYKNQYWPRKFVIVLHFN